MNRKSSVFFFLCTLVFSLQAKEEITWLNDLEKARQVSNRQKKFIVLIYQDKSIWSEKLENLFCDPVFLEKKTNLFTLCKSNAEENFSTRNLPKIFLMHPKFGVIAKVGYLPMRSGELVKYLKKQIQNFERIKEIAVNAKNFSSKEIEKAYLLAKEMGCEAFTDKLFKEGLKCSDTAFFAFERYEEQSKKFSLDDERLKDVREQVEHKDPKNIQKYHLKLAMLDFLNLSQITSQAECVIAPLLDYIVSYGDKDRENLWKIYMTISQYYLGKKDYSHSLIYARSAHKKAPRGVKKHIQNSIKYLKKIRKRDSSLKNIEK